MTHQQNDPFSHSRGTNPAQLILDERRFDTMSPSPSSMETPVASSTVSRKESNAMNGASCVQVVAKRDIGNSNNLFDINSIIESTPEDKIIPSLTSPSHVEDLDADLWSARENSNLVVYLDCSPILASNLRFPDL